MAALLCYLSLLDVVDLVMAQHTADDDDTLRHARLSISSLSLALLAQHFPHNNNGHSPLRSALIITMCAYAIYNGNERITIFVLQRIIVATILDRILCIITGYGMDLFLLCLLATNRSSARNSGPTAPVASIAIGSTFGALLYHRHSERL